MIKIDIKKEGGFDRAIKKFKYKFDKTGVVKELRDRLAFVKDSTIKRELKRKAEYKETKIPK